MLTSFVHKTTEITYSYDFRTLPIDNRDIQALNGKMEYIVERITNSLGRYYPFDIILPDIFISEEVIKDEYGKFSIDEIINIFKRAVDLIKSYPATDGIKEQLNHCSGLLQEIESCERDDIDCGELYDMLNRQIKDLQEQLADMDEDTRIIVETALNSVKNRKKSKIRLGDYNYEKNRINLYIKGIDDVFSKYQNGNRRDNLLAGLEIVLAHEVFHAVHYHCMDNRVITQKVRNKNKKKSVLEGLARWFEYTWCGRRTDHKGNGIYGWWMQKLENVCKTGKHPSDPYAALEVFLKHDKYHPDYFAKKVFEESVQYREHHWYFTYQFMCARN